MSNIRGSAYLLACAGAIALVVSLIWHPAPPTKFTGLDRQHIPTEVAGYRSRGDDTIAPEVQKALAAADLISRTYQRGDGRAINFTLIGGTDRSALHDPRSCLVGAGWAIENDHTEVIPGTNVEARFCLAVNKTSQQTNEMVYLYVVDHKVINKVTDIRTQMLLSALIGRKGTPTVFVRFMRPVAGNGSAAQEGRSDFLGFAAQMWNALKLENRQTASASAVPSTDADHSI